MKLPARPKQRVVHSTWRSGLAWCASLAALSFSLWLVWRALQYGGGEGPMVATPPPSVEPGSAAPAAEQAAGEMTQEERSALDQLLRSRGAGTSRNDDPPAR